MADLIELFPSKKGDPADADAPLTRKRRDHEEEPWCPHDKGIDLHEESERAHCRLCKREVPLFHVLTRLASEWERYAAHRDDARRQARRAQDRLDDVLRQEANAKSRLRTARRKLSEGDPAWARLEALLSDQRGYGLSRDRLREAMYGSPDEA